MTHSLGQEERGGHTRTQAGGQREAMGRGHHQIHPWLAEPRRATGCLAARVLTTARSSDPFAMTAPWEGRKYPPWCKSSRKKHSSTELVAKQARCHMFCKDTFQDAAGILRRRKGGRECTCQGWNGENSQVQTMQRGLAWVDDTGVA